MVKGLMAFKLIAVLALFLLVQVNASKEYLVQTNCLSYSNSCRTFNDYANDTDTYFTSDSSFYFMKGTHHLNVTLLITNLVNLSFVGNESDIILSDGCSIVWKGSSNIFWTSLNLIFNKANQTMNKSALYFENSHSCRYNSSLAIYGDKSVSRFDSFNSECLSRSYSQSIIFCNNSAETFGRAIHVRDSNMTLTGSVIFVANKAFGGAISIPYISEPSIDRPNFLVFQEPLDITFYANIARGVGGAIYICDQYLDFRLCESLYRNNEINKCFFALNMGLKNFISLSFTSNQAIASADIYGGALEYCLVKVGNETQHGYQVLQDLIKTSNLKSIYANFEALTACYCMNGTTPDLYNELDIRVQRDQVFKISVTVLGEFDFPVNERVAFALNYNEERSSSQLFGEPYNHLYKKGCRNLGFRILSEERFEQLTLYPPRCLFYTATLIVNIYLDDCPPGFVLTKNACKCQRSFSKVTGHEDLCDSSTGLIKCPQHDWTKPILDENLTYQGFMWSPNCPSHLCRNNKDNWLDFSSDNVDILCLAYRTEMLCGACLQNYSLTLSSLKCSKCISNNYLSLLLVFTLAGVALIASLLLFQITIADGTNNGLIFYANVINIIKDHIFPQDKLPTNPLTVFISWLNLDFGIPTCFYTGLNYYSYTWLQFVFPFYLWFLVGLIILACKYSSRAMKLFGSNPVAVLATVVLMSYNKLLHTSQQILSYMTVYYSDGTQEKRWKIDPNLLYFQGKHIPLALFGIFNLIAFLIPYIVIITFGHYLQKYSNKRGLNWLIKFKPILDAYYAPFCKNSHYWVGLTLFVRTCLSIVYSTLKNTEHVTILVFVSSVLKGIAMIPWLQLEKICQCIGGLFHS